MDGYTNYEPSGNAALFDCIYNVIATEYEKENVLCLISTVGIDSSSVECDFDIIQGTMKEMEKEKGWSFVFTNIDIRTDYNDMDLMKTIKRERKSAWKKIARKFKDDTDE
jgi:hypothetical protein